jgi:hypothetical protein
MSLISDELAQVNQHKTKTFSKDFIQRYLIALVEFIKTDLETERYSSGRG